MFEAFQLGPFLFRSHTLLLLIGVVLSTELFLRLAVSEGLRIAIFLKKAVWFFLGFLIGGRLLAVLLLHRVYTQDPMRMLIVWDGVFTVVGGCIGFGLVLLFFTWRQRGTFISWIDVLVPAATLLIAFDWLGRFFGALSYGKPTDVPWGVVLESMSVRYTVPIHPVQIYYAFWFFALTVFLLALRKKKHATGLITLVGIVLTCVGVIFLEFLRGDFAISVFAKLSDFLFLGLLFASLGMIAVLEKRISHRTSLINSVLVGLGTAAYILLRPWVVVPSVEWRFSQFLCVLVILATIVYVVAHRWKYQQH
jgi:phosphatidylglycerol:prolipoprotein diacylglycerol transferase